jgi:hypothetical protein
MSALFPKNLDSFSAPTDQQESAAYVCLYELTGIERVCKDEELQRTVQNPNISEQYLRNRHFMLEDVDDAGCTRMHYFLGHAQDHIVSRIMRYYNEQILAHPKNKAGKTPLDVLECRHTSFEFVQQINLRQATLADFEAFKTALSTK